MRPFLLIISRTLLLGACFTLSPSFSYAQENIPANPSNTYDYSPQAPVARTWMFEYQYTRLFKNGMLSGSSAIDPLLVLQSSDYKKLPYTGSPDCTTTANPCPLTNTGYKGNMDMHSLNINYQQTKDLSWLVTLNFLSNNTNFYSKVSAISQAMPYSVKSSGIGDAQLSLTNKMTDTEWFKINYTLGISLPFGNIDKPDGITDLQISQGIAPYYMQLGSGTYDIITALAFESIYDRLEYGADIYRVTRTGMNTQFYNKGDTLKLRGWGRYTFPFGTQLRGGVTQYVWSPIEGRDERIGDNTRYTGGKRMDLVFGAGQKFQDFGIYLDYAYPLLQYLNGIQLKTTGTLYFGLQYSYR